MMYQLFAVSDEWQAEERRCRRAEFERISRNEEARALAGDGSTLDRTRASVARLLVRVARALDASGGGDTAQTTASQA